MRAFQAGCLYCFIASALLNVIKKRNGAVGGKGVAAHATFTASITYLDAAQVVRCNRSRLTQTDY